VGVRARGPAGVEELVDALYRQVPTYTTLDRDADRLLDARVPFGIVTNGSRYQTHTIQALGLDTRTSCILVSELVGGRKADAAIFAAAEDGLSMARMLPSPRCRSPPAPGLRNAPCSVWSDQTSSEEGVHIPVVFVTDGSRLLRW